MQYVGFFVKRKPFRFFPEEVIYPAETVNNKWRVESSDRVLF